MQGTFEMEKFSQGNKTNKATMNKRNVKRQTRELRNKRRNRHSDLVMES